MTWTRDGYWLPHSKVCKVTVEMWIRDKVQAGRCQIRGVDDICAPHIRILHRIMTDDGGGSK